MKTLKARHRATRSEFKEDGRSKLSVKLTDEQMQWLNIEASRERTSLAEVVRRSINAAIAGKFGEAA